MRRRCECTTGRTRPRALGKAGAGAAKRPRGPCVHWSDLDVRGTREVRGTRFGRLGDLCPWDARSTIAASLTRPLPDA